MNKSIKKVLALTLTISMIVAMATMALAANPVSLPYDKVHVVEANILVVSNEDLAAGTKEFGAVDVSGEILIPMGTYSYIGDFSQGLAPVAVGGEYHSYCEHVVDAKQGFIDESGKLVIPTIYDRAYPFAEDYAVVETGDTTSVIDKSGAVTGTVSGKTNITVFEEVKFTEGMCVLPMYVDENSELPTYIAVDTKGKTVIDFQQLYVDFEYGFNSGLVKVSVGEEVWEGLGGPCTYVDRDFHSDGGYSYADKTGATVLGTYVEAYNFSDGMAGVGELVDGSEGAVEYSFISVKGEHIAQPATGFRTGQEGVGMLFSQTGRRFVDITGKTLGQAEYEDSRDFNDGYGVASNDGKLYLIDKSGNETFLGNYTPAAPYTDGVITGRNSDGKIVMLDKSGNVLSPVAIDDGFYPIDGKMVAVVDGAWGIYSLAPILKATPTNSKVLVNGTEIAFDAYTIDGNNYFKLRDVASVVSGSQKNFDVKWDGAKNAINLESDNSYTPVGNELALGDGITKNAEPTTSSIYLDGEVVELTAYTINGNNYFKLRDVCQLFDIGVTWDNATSTIGVDTAIGYVAPQVKNIDNTKK